MKQHGCLSAQLLRLVSQGIFATMLIIAGCATQNVRTIDWRIGAQRAWITKIYSPAELRQSDLDSCLSNLPESQRLAGRFAEVSYWQGRWRQLKAARIPDGVVIETGDEVELYPAVCNSRQIPVINRILRGPSVPN